MFEALQILTVVLVAIAMALALAHALEFPGKLRLGKDEYLAVQPIYYPGFTIGGFAEAIGLVATLLLVFLTPAGSLAFWLTLGAFIAFLAMHLLYWLLTHPVNNFSGAVSRRVSPTGSSAPTRSPARVAVRTRAPTRIARRIGPSCAIAGNTRTSTAPSWRCSASSCLSPPSRFEPPGGRRGNDRGLQVAGSSFRSRRSSVNQAITADSRASADVT